MLRLIMPENKDKTKKTSTHLTSNISTTLQAKKSILPIAHFA